MPSVCSHISSLTGFSGKKRPRRVDNGRELCFNHPDKGKEGKKYLRPGSQESRRLVEDGVPAERNTSRSRRPKRVAVVGSDVLRTLSRQGVAGRRRGRRSAAIEVVPRIDFRPLQAGRRQALAVQGAFCFCPFLHGSDPAAAGHWHRREKKQKEKGRKGKERER